MRSGPGDTLLIARRLVGASVVTEDGRTLGHVIDLEVDPSDRFRVVAVELGRFGWLDRFHLIRPIVHGRSSGMPRVVPWDAILRLDGGKLICRKGTRPTELGSAGTKRPPARPA